MWDPLCPQPRWDGALGNALYNPCSIQHPPAELTWGV